MAPLMPDLQLLLLEDRAADAELILRELRGAGYQPDVRRVWAEADFRAALHERAWDLILADYALPSYDGVSALTLARQERPEIPFIFVSGALGEETAVEALHKGAVDCVTKQRLGRLVPAVGRALAGTALAREHRLAEAALRDAESLYHSLVEHLPQSVFRKDREGRFTYVNRHFCAPLGKTPAEVLGKTDFDFYPAELAEQYRQDDERVMLTQEVFRTVEENHPPDRPKTVVRVVKSPVRNAAGEIVGVQGLFTDITDQIELEARFLRAQRLGSVGTLVSGICHDLNNILSPVFMCAPMLRAPASDEERDQLVTTIETSTRRAVDIVKQLLRFGCGREEGKSPLQVKHLLREMAKFAGETFPKSIEVRIDVPGDLWLVRANQTHLHQVLLNLCVNARDAMPKGGQLLLRAQNVVLDEHYASMNIQAKPGRYLKLQVSDTGCGIPEEVRERIFEPLFTTKAAAEGTGLGLTTVLGIVQDHGGFITVTSAEGQGTTFNIHLPADSEQQPDVEPRPACPDMPCGQGELVLLVDDEPAILLAAERTLLTHRYQVLHAGDGVEGLALFTSHKSAVRAVVTDLVMPRMDGATLCRILRQVSPETPIIVSSGALQGKAGEMHLKTLAELGIRHILQKPYQGEALLQTLRAALSGSPGAQFPTAIA